MGWFFAVFGISLLSFLPTLLSSSSSWCSAIAKEKASETQSELELLRAFKAEALADCARLEALLAAKVRTHAYVHVCAYTCALRCGRAVLVDSSLASFAF
jgi:hypothetical protein